MQKAAIHSHLATAETQQSLRAALQDRRLSHLKVGEYGGGIAAAVDQYAEAETPALLIVEAPKSLSVEGLLAHLGQLANRCSPQTAVLVIGWLNDVGLYRTLIDMGVADYFVQPTPPEALIPILHRLTAGDTNQPKGKVTVFLGAVGGAGVSTLAFEHAQALGQRAPDGVWLLDLDLAHGTQDLLADRPGREAVRTSIQSPQRLDAGSLARLAESSGPVRLLSAGGTLASSDLDPAMVQTLVGQLAQTAENLVIDLPHLWLPWTQAVLKQADRVVLVTRPTLAGFRNARNLIAALAGLRPFDPHPLLILNQIAPRQAAQPFMKDLIKGLAPLTPALIADCAPALEKAQAAGKPLVVAAPSASISKAAQALCGAGATKATSKPGLLAGLLRRLPGRAG
ncbi:CpaE family protein [Lacibacterium aquatile]|uniref:CpaE family protein n=1 Tax=Lacibacterium aquatile TaxID=1168082 RepID=A0ABW5DRK2_9PROT